MERQKALTVFPPKYAIKEVLPMLRKVAILALVCVAGLSPGCARRVSAEDLAGGGADVGISVTLKSGETLRGRLVSLSDDRMVVDAVYVDGGDVSITGSGDNVSVLVAGVPVQGELISSSRDGGERTAVVRRVIDPADVADATFHKSSSDASLGPTLSLIVGPAVGALLALLI
jgi:hypothetical protein